jgi:hypothetical protein
MQINKRKNNLHKNVKLIYVINDVEFVTISKTDGYINGIILDSHNKKV